MFSKGAGGSLSLKDWLPYLELSDLSIRQAPGPSNTYSLLFCHHTVPLPPAALALVYQPACSRS